jgi:hypothetical protein
MGLMLSLLRMAFYFDDPAAFFSPQDDEDLEIYSRVAAGIPHRGESLDEIQAVPCNAVDAPPVSSWKQSNDDAFSITVDRAREDSTKQAQHEIDFIRRRARTVMATGDDVPELLNLTEFFFWDQESALPLLCR